MKLLSCTVTDESSMNTFYVYTPCFDGQLVTSIAIALWGITLLSFPNSSGLQYTWPLFFWVPLAIQPTPGLSRCVFYVFFFSFFEDFHGRPVYHKIMERCGWDCRSFACQAKMVVFEPKLSEATFRSAVKRCKKVISTFHGNFSWNNEWISVSCYHSWMAGRWFNKLSWDRKTSFSIFNIVRVS